MGKSLLVERLSGNELIKIIKENKIKHQVRVQRRKGHEQKEIYVLVEITHIHFIQQIIIVYFVPGIVISLKDIVMNRTAQETSILPWGWKHYQAFLL